MSPRADPLGLKLVRVCVFCGSTSGTDERYVSPSPRGGALANAGLAAGAEVIGVIPHVLVDKELAHPGLSDLRLVTDMHERKATMAVLADAFVARLHSKRIGLLDTGGFYQPLLAFLDRVVEAGFLPRADRDALCVAAEPQDLVEQLMTNLKEPS